jgi:hypothetical protein
VHLVPELAVDDRLVFARVRRALVDGFADVNSVVQELIEDTLIEHMAVPIGGVGCDELPSQEGCRLQLDEPPEDRANRSASASWMISLRSRTS